MIDQYAYCKVGGGTGQYRFATGQESTRGDKNMFPILAIQVVILDFGIPNNPIEIELEYRFICVYDPQNLKVSFGLVPPCERAR